MPKFIEAHDFASNVPVAINTDTIARVYQREAGKVVLVLTTLEEKEYVDTDDMSEEPGITLVTAVSERVMVRGTYIEVMRKIAAAT